MTPDQHALVRDLVAQYRPGHGLPRPFYTTPALYDLELDPTEQKNVANNHPDIVERMKKLMQAEREELGDLRLGIQGKGVRPRGEVSYDPRAKAGAAAAPSAK